MFLNLYPTPRSGSILAWAPTVAQVLWGPGQHQSDGMRELYTIAAKCKRRHLKHLLRAPEWGLSVGRLKTRHWRVVVAVWTSLSLTWCVNSRMQCSGSASPTDETIASGSCCTGTDGSNTVGEERHPSQLILVPRHEEPQDEVVGFLPLLWRLPAHHVRWRSDEEAGKQCGYHRGKRRLATVIDRFKKMTISFFNPCFCVSKKYSLTTLWDFIHQKLWISHAAFSFSVNYFLYEDRNIQEMA